MERGIGNEIWSSMIELEILESDILGIRRLRWNWYNFDKIAQILFIRTFF